jgi:hypothetical protein
MSEAIYAIKDREGRPAGVDFVELLHKSGLLEDFEFQQIMIPELYFRDAFLEHIAKHGLSSLFRFDLVMEDITSPTLSVNDLERVVSRFVSGLDGAKRIMVIDPYFYGSSATPNVASLFQTLLATASSALEEIIFVTNGMSANKSDIHAAVNAVAPSCNIVDVTTQAFHDRFWVDPDASKGIVMGTSLNGLGRKIALVDRLQDADVTEIVSLAKAAGVPL